MNQFTVLDMNEITAFEMFTINLNLVISVSEYKVYTINTFYI